MSDMRPAGARARSATAPNTEDRGSQLQPFFRIWLDIERRGRLEAEQSSLKGASTERGDANQLTGAGASLVELAALVEARSLKDIAYKLAFWRRNTPEIDDRSKPLCSRDIVAYSAFRDLVRLTGLRTLATLEDIETDFHRKDIF